MNVIQPSAATRHLSWFTALSVSLAVMACQPAANTTVVPTQTASAAPATQSSQLTGNVSLNGAPVANATIRVYDAVTGAQLIATGGDNLVAAGGANLVAAGGANLTTDAQGNFSLSVANLAPGTVARVVATGTGQTLSALVSGNGLQAGAPGKYSVSQTRATIRVALNASTTAIANVIVAALKVAAQLDASNQLKAFERVFNDASLAAKEIEDFFSKNPNAAQDLVKNTREDGQTAEDSLKKAIMDSGAKEELQNVVTKAAETVNEFLAAGATVDGDRLTADIVVPGVDLVIQIDAGNLSIESPDGTVIFQSALPAVTAPTAAPTSAPSADATAAPTAVPTTAPASTGGGGDVNIIVTPQPSGVPSPSNASTFLPHIDAFAISPRATGDLTGGDMSFTVSQPANNEDIKTIIIRLPKKNSAGNVIAELNTGSLSTPAYLFESRVQIPASASPAQFYGKTAAGKLSNSITLPERLGAGVLLNGADALWTGTYYRDSNSQKVADVQIFENPSFYYFVFSYDIEGGVELNKGHISTLWINSDIWKTLSLDIKPQVYFESRLNNSVDIDPVAELFNSPA